jgi:hypothetical protein
MRKPLAFADGARVVLFDRDGKLANKTADEMTRKGMMAESMEVDVTEEWRSTLRRNGSRRATMCYHVSGILKKIRVS